MRIYEIENVSCPTVDKKVIRVDEIFDIYIFGRIKKVAIKAVLPGGVAFTLKDQDIDSKITRKFVSNETFIFSYWKHKVI